MTRFQRYIKQVEEGDEGFTLIELMVVVLIIGILMAIAIPTFLGAKNSANARAAQSNLANSITAEQAYFSNNQTYATGALLQPDEPAITYTDAGTAAAPTTTGNTVTVEGTPSASSVMLGAKGADKKCYYAYDLSGQMAYYTDAACGAPPTPPTATTMPAPGTPPSSVKADGTGQWAANW